MEVSLKILIKDSSIVLDSLYCLSNIKHRHCNGQKNAQLKKRMTTVTKKREQKKEEKVGKKERTRKEM